MREFGAARAERYRGPFEGLRSSVGHADHLGALQGYRAVAEQAGPDDQRLLPMSSFLVDHPSCGALIQRALEAIEHPEKSGPTVILSDGDVGLQPHKVQGSGLRQAVEGRVLIYVQKERMLDAVERHYPARHYVLVDDTPRILAAAKRLMNDGLTTVFPRQGHHAFDANELARYPAAELTGEHIGELVDLDVAKLLETR